MNLEVLISCMNQQDMRIAEQTGIQTDALIVNQCPQAECSDDVSLDRNASEVQSGSRGTIRMIRTNTRGLSKSRNLAIQHAVGDACLLCDDDEQLDPSYEDTIQKAYETLPDADIICFRILNQPSRLTQKTQRLTKWTAMRIASWQITFRREPILKSGIRFDEDMGAGTGNGGGEEVKFLRDCIKAGLKAYYVPKSIGTVAQTESTWFRGFDRDFFYKRGITNRYMLGLPVSILYAAYYTMVKRDLYKEYVTPWQSFKYTLDGIIANDIAKQKKRRMKK
jgi:glycosyltransferase involved in cell wall biosynthesis